MNKAIEFLKLNLKQNDTIVVACSGGPDSMCLSSILCSLKKEYNLKIIIAHVNHKVREESEEEKSFVEKYALKNNCIFESIELNKITKNFEQKAREERYDFFENLIKKYQAQYLMTAHHGDDLIETILMRISRGSTLKGYSGFSTITDKGSYKIIRPLIFYTKNDILNYMSSIDEDYRLDKTNEEDTHTRNRYRHHLLPFLKSENKDVNQKFLEYSKTILESDNFINNYTNKIFKKAYSNNILNLDIYNKEEDFIKERLIEKILDTLYINNLYLITSSNCREIMKLISSNKPNCKLKLPDNHTVTKKYNQIFVDQKESINEVNIKFKDIISINKQTIKQIHDCEDKSNYITRLDSKELNLPLIVRTILPKDKMVIKNLNGTKKLKDIFIDAKLSLEERKNQLILVDQSGVIVWIPGLKKSKFDKEKNQKYDIILRYTKEGE